MGELKLGEYRLRTPAVCGAVTGENLGEMRAGIARAMKQGADLVELRVDGLHDRAGWEKLLRRGLPIILTNRPEREGGSFKGNESERVGVLLSGISRGVPCVDMELSTPQELRERVISEAKKSGVTVMVSHHDFSMTPSIGVLVDIAKNLARAGCDLAKIVTFAESSGDALRVLDFLVQVQDEVAVPTIAFAMGEAGRITRIAAPLFGSPLVYAAARKETGPGQLDVATTKRLLRELIPKVVKD